MVLNFKISDYLSDDYLIKLGALHGVDKKNHKITGAFVLKSFVQSALMKHPISLRGLEDFTLLHPDLSLLLKTKQEEKRRIDHSSLGKRLEKISVDYFKGVYMALSDKANEVLKGSEGHILHRFDSTILNLSGRVIQEGLHIGGKEKDTQIKMSISLKGSLPRTIRFCKEQSESSENVALIRAINEAKLDKEDILLFDRGISKSDTFCDLTERNVQFITKVGCDRKHTVMRSNQLKEHKEEENVKILKDDIVRLENRQKRIWCDTPLRLVKISVKNKDNKEVAFLTNIMDMPADEVATLYRKRWDIEVFFKFLKQHLGFKHFIAHHLNGMMVYLYSLLIASILFVLFKYKTGENGFKRALLKFKLLLQKELLRDLIILSGGDPQKINILKT